MLAMDYRGPYRVRATQKPEPAIEHPGDAIVQVMRSCICGSDLHLYHGLVPDTRVGTTFGHEFVGRVVETGPDVRKLKAGDRVLVPFNIFCGTCFFCKKELYSNCHNTNPEATAVGGIFGYSHTTGGYDGGQAEYVRVPMADVGPTIIPADLDADDAGRGEHRVERHRVGAVAITEVTARLEGRDGLQRDAGALVADPAGTEHQRAGQQHSADDRHEADRPRAATARPRRCGRPSERSGGAHLGRMAPQPILGRQRWRELGTVVVEALIRRHGT